MPNDAKTRFADNDTIAANAAGEVDPVGDVLDLWGQATNPRIDFFPNEGDKPNDLGDDRLVWETMVTTALVGVENAVVTLSLYNHTAATSVNSGDLIDSVVFTIGASLGIPVGKFLTMNPLPARRMTKRYLAMHCAVATQNLTSGSVDSSLTSIKEANQAHGTIDPLS